MLTGIPWIVDFVGFSSICLGHMGCEIYVFLLGWKL